MVSDPVEYEAIGRQQLELVGFLYDLQGTDPGVELLRGQFLLQFFSAALPKIQAYSPGVLERVTDWLPWSGPLQMMPPLGGRRSQKSTSAEASYPQLMGYCSLRFVY